jgi:hypothetical protein
MRSPRRRFRLRKLLALEIMKVDRPAAGLGFPVNAARPIEIVGCEVTTCRSRPRIRLGVALESIPRVADSGTSCPDLESPVRSRFLSQEIVPMISESHPTPPPFEMEDPRSVRQAHISHEASIKSIGVLYFIGSFSLDGILIGFFKGKSRAFAEQITICVLCLARHNSSTKTTL